MKNLKLIFLFLFISLIANITNAQSPSLVNASPAIKENSTGDLVKVWMSTADEAKKLTQEPDVNFISDTKGGPAYVINVKDNITYQKWIGCGAHIDDGVAWLIFKNLDKTVKDDLMYKLFNKSAGIGMDWVRQSMGSDDATVMNNGWWTYDDMPKGQTDPDLVHFSIDMEKDYILPMVKQAIQINPNLKIVGCPHTPPGWMKTSADDPNPLNHGSVQPKYYSSFANYFVKFIQSYDKEGIPIYGISIQNEPLTGPLDWQVCNIPADVERDLIKNYFVPIFKKNGLTPKIFIFDHNWDIGWDYVTTVYADPIVYKAVAGSMWHHYGGKPAIMTEVHNAYPEKEIWFTEGCATSTWFPNGGYIDFNTYRNSFLNFSYNVINIPRNWCQTMMMYQIAMDPDHRPANFSPPTNYGMVTVDPKDRSVTFRPEYYTLGHISKFVYPDAYRIESNQYEGDIESLAFKNPDGSIVLVLSNRSRFTKNLKIKWGPKAFIYSMTGESMITFKWGGKK